MFFMIVFGREENGRRWGARSAPDSRNLAGAAMLTNRETIVSEETLQETGEGSTDTLVRSEKYCGY